jgi:hypothetical protein
MFCLVLKQMAGGEQAGSEVRQPQPCLNLKTIEPIKQNDEDTSAPASPSQKNLKILYYRE